MDPADRPDPEFDQLLSDVIERYRAVLEELAEL